MNNLAVARRRRNWITLLFAVIILVPSMLGFATKFFEFAHTFQDQADGAFAITPMVNYLLASLGFLCMLVWAAYNGMFHDMEGPKYTMLEREQQLDQEAELDEGQRWPRWEFPERQSLPPRGDSTGQHG